MSLRFAPFERAMADELVPMWREAFERGTGIVDPHPIDDQRRHLIERVWPEHAVTVALDDGAGLVGFLACNATSISQLHVRVGWHRRGIGSALLERAKEASAGALWLHTFARNANARRFYEARGFVAVAFGFEPFWQLEDVRYEWRRPP
jgi:ribosomal protein S18 acetylase RimI-like enzyme